MDERLNRKGFDRLDSAEKETLMRELAGRRLREIGWEPVALDDPRLTCHEDWMAE